MSRTIDRETGLTVIPAGVYAGMELGNIRSRLSGLHFAKEALSQGECEILYLAEALLHVMDVEAAGGYRR